MDDEFLDQEAIETERYEHMCFARRVVLCSFAEILYQRKLLAKGAFKATRARGTNLIVFDAKHEDALDSLIKLRHILQDIENELVKTVRLVIHCPEEEQEKEQVGEMFEMNLYYGDKISVAVKMGDNVEHFKYNRRTENEDFRAYICRLRQFCRLLNDLPVGSYGRYHVLNQSGKQGELSGGEYFENVRRCPFKWTGPKQEIAGVVGRFNRREIGVKMTVGTHFGSARTDSDNVASNLKEENWSEGGWDELRRERKEGMNGKENRATSRGVAYRVGRERERRGEEVEYQRNDMNEGGDAYDFADDMRSIRSALSDVSNRSKAEDDTLREERREEEEEERRTENKKEEEERRREIEVVEEAKKREKKRIEEERRSEKRRADEERRKEKKREEERKKEEKRKEEEEKKREEMERSREEERKRSAEKLKRKGDSSVERVERGREKRRDYGSEDRAERGSSIDTITVTIVNEEAEEKDGRMEKRKKRRKMMEERKRSREMGGGGGEGGETTEPEVELTVADVVGVKKGREGGESKSSTDSGGKEKKTPGQCEKKRVEMERETVG